MRSSLVLLGVLLLFGGSAHGASEIAGKDVDLKLFDATGQRVRWLRAASATGSFTAPVLKDGTVDFFRGVDTIAQEKIGTLTFTDAAYDPGRRTIESQSAVRLAFAGGNLTAVGFKYEIAAGRLTLKSNVALDFPDAHANANEGEIVLAESGGMRDLLISIAAIRGNVQLTGPKLAELQCDRAVTSSAIYTGSDDTLVIGTPATAWNKGEKTGELNGDVKIKAGNRPSRAAAPSALPQSTSSTAPASTPPPSIQRP